MKIIKEGQKIEKRSCCPYCQCQFEYDNTDIYIDYSYTSPNSYVICPSCHQKVFIYNYSRVYTPTTWPEIPTYPWWPQSPYNGPIVTLDSNWSKEHMKGENE